MNKYTITYLRAGCLWTVDLVGASNPRDAIKMADEFIESAQDRFKNCPIYSNTFEFRSIQLK